MKLKRMKRIKYSLNWMVVMKNVEIKWLKESVNKLSEEEMTQLIEKALSKIMCESYLNGNKIVTTTVDPLSWRYPDDLSPIIDENGKFNYRPCPKCNKYPTPEGYDACFGYLTGVRNACCGHGVEDGYIQFGNGKVIRFNNVRVD